MTDDDAPVNGTARNAAAEAVDASKSDPVSEPRPDHLRKSRHGARNPDGTFKRLYPKSEAPSTYHKKEPSPRTRSRVTNRKALFLEATPNSAQARRFADIFSQIIADLGGHDAPLSEAQRQLARRGAALSVSCEILEQSILTGTSAAEVAPQAQSGGLSSFTILKEAGRVLHAVARSRGGDSIGAIAKLPDAALDRVTDLLVKAGDLAAKAISAGSAQSADLQLLGELSDRCGRTFSRLGLARTPREIGVPAMAYRRQHDEVFSPLRSELAKAAQRQQNAQDADELAPIDVPSEAAE